jgi:uncharacterized protein (TIGR01777 family)
MRIFVTGGTGLIGRSVVQHLAVRGDEVVVLSRSAKSQPGALPKVTFLAGDPSTPGDWLNELASCDAVIHLAGEPIAQRWTKAARQRVWDSRVVSTTLIAEELAKNPKRADGSPKVLLCSSGVSYYGVYRNNATEFTENDLPGSGFLADVCVSWEAATTAAVNAGVRVATLRTGMVLSKEDGALPLMAKPFRFFVGGVVGGGKQWISWIHHVDMTGLILFILDRAEVSGPFNMAAPEAITNWGFSKALANALHRPCWLPVPSFMLHLLLGGMAELATHGQRVVPMKAKQLGYVFQYPLLEPALAELYKR